MAHEEVKALYEIDKQHSDTPWEYWEMKTRRGHWINACVPGFFCDVEYRRKTGAPVWPDDKEDARKWRELVELAGESGGISFEKFKEIRDGKEVEELIQGYTADQWQAIIDGKFLCEFSGTKDFIRDMGKYCLHSIDDERLFRVADANGNRWFAAKYCRPLRTKGVRQPWFGGECPVAKDTKVLVKLRSGQNHKASTGSHLFWDWDNNRASYNIVEFIEL